MKTIRVPAGTVELIHVVTCANCGACEEVDESDSVSAVQVIRQRGWMPTTRGEICPSCSQPPSVSHSAGIGDRIEITDSTRTGKTGTVIDVHGEGKITAKLDEPEMFPTPVAQLIGIGGTDLIVLSADQYRVLQ